MTETEEKLSHLLSHWAEHSDAHVENYRVWAARAREGGLLQVAEAMDQAVMASEETGRALRKAAGFLVRENRPGSLISSRKASDT